ncbi:MAG: hypothetical protein LAN70_02130 [Acidobacteriia bacterium]|nr:hypothetical protein [Terriglobia bacterium]
MRLFRWSCEGCGAKGEAVISKPANLNLLAAAQGRPGVTGIDANLLPNRSDASTIAAAHRRHSPRCSLQPVVDLRSEGEQLADASPAQPSGGAA